MTRPAIALIAAMDRHRLIGAGNRMPWHLPDDLRRFRALTTGHPVIMGRRTHESIGRALPGRRNLVITRQATYAAAGCEIVASLENAIVACKNVSMVFVIGGGEVYVQALALATHLFLTEIDRTFAGDTWFPEFDRARWRIVREERRNHPGEPAFDYRFVDYVLA